MESIDPKIWSGDLAYHSPLCGVIIDFVFSEAKLFICVQILQVSLNLQLVSLTTSITKFWGRFVKFFPLGLQFYWILQNVLSWHEKRANFLPPFFLFSSS